MPLNEYQIDWIGRIKASPITDEIMDAAKKNVGRREDYIEKVLKTVVDQKRQAIDDAQREFSITKTTEYHGKERVWRAVTLRSQTVTEELPWRVTDEDRDINLIRPDTDVRADLEIDTKEDVRNVIGKDGKKDIRTEAIAQSDIEKLADAYAALNELQQHMIAQVDDEGNRLFTDDDIRRELWSPIVREGLVPDNMVPEKFSDEAAAFAGASQVYGEKLKDFTKKSTGRESELRTLGILVDVTNVLTTGASSLATIINANQIAQLQRDMLDPNNSSRIKEMGNELLMLQAPAATALAAGAVVGGGLGIIRTWVENEGKRATDDQWWAKAGEATATILVDIVTKSVTAGISFGGSASKGTASIASGAIQAGFNSLRIAATFIQIAQEPNEEKRKKLLTTLGLRIADVVGNGLLITSGAMTKAASELTAPKSATVDDKMNAGILNGQAAEINQIAAGVTAGIKATANGPLIYEMVKNGRYKEAALLLGGGVVQAALSGASESIVADMKRDVTAAEFKDMRPDQRLYAEAELKPVDMSNKQILSDPNNPDSPKRAETDAERDYRIPREKRANEEAYELRQTQASADMIATLEKSLASLNKSALANLQKQPQVVLDDTVLDRIAKEIEAETVLAKQQAVKDELKAAFTDEAVDEMFAEFGTKMKGYETFYADAYPVTDLEGTPESDLEAAMSAINRAMERTSELRAKVELINGVTAATAGVIAAIIPGAGAVAAAQKVAYDIYQLIQHVDAHNRWVKSMQVAFSANSAYSASIERTMTNAEITMSRTAVTLVLDSLNLGAQVGRCFDPTGATTATAAGLTMTQALVDFGYKMQKEDEVRTGWNLYVDARDNPGNRKRARKAMRGNSTLAKCAIAYGACIVGDAVAKEAIRRSGLTPEILANDKDVCKQLVSYLENELIDDPVVLHVDKKAKDWMPDDRPYLTAVSWLQFKKAANLSATPRLSNDSVATPAIDSLLAQLGKNWSGKASYVDALKGLGTPDEQTLADFATKSEEILAKLVNATTAYKPMQDIPMGTAHKDFGDITKTLTQLAKLNLATAAKDSERARALLAALI